MTGSRSGRSSKNGSIGHFQAGVVHATPPDARTIHDTGQRTLIATESVWYTLRCEAPVLSMDPGAVSITKEPALTTSTSGSTLKAEAIACGATATRSFPTADDAAGMTMALVTKRPAMPAALPA